MAQTVIPCRNPDCPTSIENKPIDFTPMVCTGETISVWLFKCPTCRNPRAIEKRLIGGTVGIGRRDDGTGPTGGKGPLKYRPGWGG